MNAKNRLLILKEVAQIKKNIDKEKAQHGGVVTVYDNIRTMRQLMSATGMEAYEIERVLESIKEEGFIAYQKNSLSQQTHFIISPYQDFDAKYREFLKKENSISSNSKVVTLKNKKMEFKDEEGLIIIDGYSCVLPKHRYEHSLCRVMFHEKVKNPVQVADIYMEITGDEIGYGDIKSKLKTVQDTMYRINERIQVQINTKDNLFSWENKLITRNY